MRENKEKDSREPKDPLSEMEKLLRSIDRPGNYCAGGRMFAPMPALEAKGTGRLSFPVPPEQAEELFSRGRLSPFGKGTETLRDESVRSSREFEPGEISLGGGGWEKTLEELKDAAAQGLGCPRDRLEAEFYKLLVYAPGGFFLPHRDTEKSEGMVGTLVVSLPVAGGSSGGEIVVRHGERETSLDMSGAGDPSEIAWAAFYADCPHEVLPVTEGHRIALVFNLRLRNGDGLRAADFDETEKAMTRALSAWGETAGRTEKIIVLLEHDYSQAGLSFGSMKNADAARAAVLAKAARAASCELYAATVDIFESATPDYDGYGGYTEGDEAFTEESLIESDYSLGNFVAPDGTKPGFEDIGFDRDDILPPDALCGREPDEEGLEQEWMGNADATYDRVYRLAAFVLWPEAGSLFVIASASRKSAVGYAEALAKRDPGAGRAAAAALPELWSGQQTHRRSSEGLRSAIDLLMELEDVSTLRELLEVGVIPHYDSSFNDRAAAVLEAVGSEEGERFLARLARENLAERTKGILALAGGVSREFSGREGWSVAVSRMCAEISKNLADALSEKKKGIWNKDKFAFSPGTVENLLSSFLSAGLEEEAAQAADIVLNDPESASPDRVIPRALERLRGFRETAAFSKLWERSAGFLLERSENPPEEPGDWAISPPSGPRGGCGCALCGELVGFCEDPVATERRFTAVESLRNHLTGVVEEDSLDISLRTEKDRRPYTLVCTKNRASHERGLKRYEEDTVEMKRLLAAAPPSAGELAKRLRKAVGTDQPGFREL